MKSVTINRSVPNRKPVAVLSLFAATAACFVMLSSNAVAQTPAAAPPTPAAPSSAPNAAAQPTDPNCCPPAAPSYTQYGSRYYGAIDPYPIGYYPYATAYAPAAYAPATVAAPYALGYYPYPPAVAYAVPAPYLGYYGYAGYAGSPYFGFPGWGWGPIYPYGFGY